ncbi:MAG: hypothetical protein ACI4S0_01800 [Dorea sp.]
MSPNDNNQNQPLVEIILSHATIKLGETNRHKFTQCQLGPCKPEAASSIAFSISVRGDDWWDTEAILTNHMNTPIPIIRNIKPQCSSWIRCLDAQGVLVDGIELMYNIKKDIALMQTAYIQVNDGCLSVKNTHLANSILVKIMLSPDGNILLSHGDKVYAPNFESCIMTYKDLYAWD